MRRYISLFLFLCTLLLAGVELKAAIPGASARYVTFTNVASTSGTMSWVNGNGYGRIVVVNTDNNWAEEDAILTANAPAYADKAGNLTGAPQVGATGSYVIDVLTGTQRSTAFTNFTANTTYYVKVYEFNLNGNNRDYRNNSATLNPRTFTTMQAIAAPVIALGTDGVTGAYAAFTWPRIGGDDLTEYVVDISDDNFTTYYEFYQNLDVGVLDNTNPEVFEAYVPHTGTYKIRARAKIGTSYSTYSDPVEFTISDVTPPKFDIDPVLAMGTNLMTVQVVFDEEVTQTADKVAGALVAADFGVYDFAANGGNTINVAVIDAVKDNATTYTLTLSFSGITTGSETFRIGPADNWSIFDMQGNPMDADDPNSVTDQKTNAITCNKATVFNSSKSLAYVTINQAVTGADAADFINLLDGETYTEDVDLEAKPLTISGINAAGDDIPILKPIIIGTITVSNDAAETTNLSQINFNCANVDANKTNAVVLGNIAGTLSVTGCNFTLDGTDKAIKANAGANLNKINIGNNDAAANYNTFTFGAGEANAQVGVDLSGATGGVILPNNGSINLRGNSFTFANAADIGVLIEPARSTDPAATPTRTLEFRANTFANAGTAISFNRVYTDNEYPVFSTINVGSADEGNGNAFNNTGKAINMAYAEGSDLVDVMPFINLFPTRNTFAEANTGFTAGYYHNGTVIGEGNPKSFDDASWLAPGPVLRSDNNTAGTDDAVYPTIRSGYAAVGSDNQHLFIMDENTYDWTSGENDQLAELVIDKAFTHTIKGKSKSAKIKEEWLAAGTAAKTITITNLTFEIDPIAGNAGEAKAYGIQIADVPATAVITINDNNFNYGRYTYGIANKPQSTTYGAIADLVLEGTVNITNNTFKSNETTARAGHDMGISFGWGQYFQLAAGGLLNISTNNFSFNCSTSPIDYTNTEAGSKYGSIGVYIGTYNSVAASEGTLTLAGNTFNGAAAGFNGVGTSVLFENTWYSTEANPTEPTTKGMTTAHINIYNGNNFNQVGYGIAFHTFPASAEVFSTLPDYIDLYGTTGNSNFTAADIYHAAWYDLTTDDAAPTTNSKLYPSIQTAVDVNRANDVNVGAGTYNENVEVVNASNVTGFLGQATESITCELATGKTLTLGEELTGTTSGFFAPKVILSHSDAKMNDAIALVKAEGTIEIADAVVIIGNAIANKAVTITESAGAIGTYNGNLTISHPGITVSNLTLGGNPAISVQPTSDLATPFAITGNTFNLANAGTGIQVSVGKQSGSFNLNILNVTTNTFTGGDATSQAIAFNSLNVANDAANFATINATANTFNNSGYSFIQNVTNNVCGCMSTVNIGTNPNQNTFGGNLLDNHIKGFDYTPALAAKTTTASVLTADCAAPTSEAGDFVSLTPNAVADATTNYLHWDWPNKVNGYINGTYTEGVKVKFDLTNIPDLDATLLNGTIKMQTSVSTNGVDFGVWTDFGSAVTITDEMLNEDGYHEFTMTYAELVGTSGDGTPFTSGLLDADGHKIKFRAVVTDMAGNVYESTVTSTEWVRDITAPALSITQPALEGQIMQNFSLSSGTTDNAAYPTFRFAGQRVGANWWTEADYSFSSATKAWSNINSWAGNDWTYAISPVVNSNGDYQIYAQAIDAAGNVTTVRRNFTLINERPSVTNFERLTDNTLKVTFSEAVELNKSQMIANYTVVRKNVAGETVSTLTPTSAVRGNNIGVTDDEVTLTFAGTPFDANLPECNTLTLTVGATVANGVRDIAGNLIDNGTVRTEGISTGLTNNQYKYLKPDLTAPKVVSIKRKTPAIAAGVPTKETTITYTVEFSEAVQNVNVEDFALEVTGGATGTIGTPEVWDDNDKKYDVPVTVTAAPNASTIELTILGTAGIGDIKCQDGAEALSNTPYTSGDIYTVDQTAPTVASVTPNVTMINESKVGDKKFTVTVDFDEAMDQTVAPTLEFTDAVAALTLDETEGTGSRWADADTYIAVYDVADDNSTIADVDITINAAKDVAGNTMTESENTDEFDVDLVQPTIVSVTPSATMINEALVGDKAFTVTVVFDEAMDQTVAPTLTFDAPATALSLDNTALTGSRWTSETTYLAVYDVADNNTTISAVDIDITLAQDLATNVMVADITSGVDKFSVDLAKPTIVSVTPNATMINESLVGDKTFTVTVVFNEAMNQEVAPTLTFDAAVAALTLDNTAETGSRWTSETTYLAVYDVADNNTTISAVDIDITLAQDLATNVMDADITSGVDEFSVDLAKPTVSSVTPNVATIAKSNAGDNAFTLTVVFNEDMDQNVAPTLAFTPAAAALTLDNTAITGSRWTNATTYLAVYDVTDNNTNIADIDVTVTAAKDLAGNTMDASENANEFSIDLVKPTVTNVAITPNNSANTNGYAVNNATTTLTVAVTFDEAMNAAPTLSFSPVISARLSLNTAGAWNAGPDPAANTVYTIVYNVSNAAPGVAYMNAADYYLAITNATDAAGNTQEAKQVTNIKADQVLPAIQTVAFACQNGTADVTFTEPVARLANFTGNLTATSLTYDYDENGSPVTITGINVTHVAGNANASIALTITNGEQATGDEIFKLGAFAANRIFDAAGNSMVSPGWVNGQMKITPDAPTGDAAQNFCASANPTLADIAVSGLDGAAFAWYEADEGGVALAINTPLVDGADYYATQTKAGCESVNRKAVTVTVITSPTPTGDATQTFCVTDAPKVSNITVGALDAAYELVYKTNADALIADPAGTALNNGEVIRVYSKHTATDCLSASYLEVTANIQQAAVAGNINPTTPAGNICRGTVLTATFTEGSGGTGAVYEYQTLSGANWSDWATYVVGTTAINTTNIDGVQIKNTRTGGTCAPASKTLTWTVVELPTVTTVATPQTRCDNGNVTFTAATTTEGAVIDWSLDNFATTLQTNNSFTTAITVAASPVTVYYRARTIATGCVSATQTTTGTAYATPIAKNVSGGPFCANTEATITVADGVAGISYKLYRDKGLAGEAVITTTTPANAGNVVFTVPNAIAGTYSVYATNNACNTEIAMNGTVTVNPAVVAAITSATGNTCGVNPFQVSDASVSNYTSYVWTENGAGSLNDDDILNPTYTPAVGDAGNYVTLTLTVTALGGCNQVVLTKTLSVALPAPAAPNVVGAIPAGVCQGTASTLTASSNNNPTEYKWYNAASDGELLYTGATYEVTPNATTTYYVSAENGCGTSNRTAVTVTVNSIPNAPVVATNTVTYNGAARTIAFNALGANEVLVWYADNAGTKGATAAQLSRTNVGSSSAWVSVRNSVTTCESAAIPVTLTVNPLALTYTLNPVSKTYNGNANTTGTITLTNAIPGDDVTAAGTFTFVNATAQNGKQVNVTAITLDGAQKANYSIDATANTTANITPLALTFDAVANGKVYDGNTNTTGTITLTNKVGGDDVSATGTFAFVTATAANGKQVNVTAITLAGAAMGNYTIANSANTTANITPLPLTFTVAADNKVYDRNTTATGTITLTNKVGGDDVSATGTFAFATANAEDNKAVNVTAITLAGAAMGNYTIDATANTTANITKLPLTFNAVANSKDYNGNANTTGAINLTNVINPDVVSATGTFTFANATAANGKVVNVTAITLDGADKNNYSIDATANANANINKVMLTVTADNKAKCFGQPDPELTYQITGYVNGEGIGVVNGRANFGLVRTGAEAVGGYAINADVIGDLSADNYNFQFTAGTFTINPLPTTTVSGNNTVAATFALELTAADAMTSYTWTATGTPVITNANQRTAQFTWATEGPQTVTLTYGNGTCTNTAQLVVNVTASCVNLAIGTQPVALERVIGENAELSVVVTGTNPQYQWYKNDVAINGATSSTLTLTNVQYTDAANYHVVVTNTCSNVQSNAVALNVYIGAPTTTTAFTITSTNAANLIANISAVGNGGRKLVVIRKGTTATTFVPADGTNYPAPVTAQYGLNLAKDEADDNESYIVYNDVLTAPSSLGISGLNSRTNYTVTIFEYNRDGVNNNTINYGVSNSVTGLTRRKDVVEGEEKFTGESFEISKVAPNPVRDQINFSIMAVDGGEFAIELVNVSGETVLSRNQMMSKGANAMSVNLFTEKGMIAAGTYFLKVTSAGETLTQQVVVLP